MLSRNLTGSLLFSVALGLVPGCAEILDGDHDYRLDTGGSTGTGGSGATGGGGSGGGGSGGGGGGTTTSTVEQCGSGETACGPLCTVLDSDPLNCGACGHDCQGASCTGGACEIDVLVTGLNQPYGIAVDQSHVYYSTSDGKVARVPKNGSNPQDVAQTIGALGDLALYDGFVYVANRGMRIVQRVTKNGIDGLAALTPELNGLTHIEVDATGVYFVAPFDVGGTPAGTIGRAPHEGGAVTWLAQDLARPNDLAILGSRVYFSQGIFDQGQNQYVDGSICEAVDVQSGVSKHATGEIVPLSIVAEGDDVYWGNDVTKNVRSLKVSTGETATLAEGQDVPGGMALDAEHVYWTTSNGGAVMRAPRKGGAPLVLAFNRAHPLSIAVDDKRVYWVESTPNGVVASVPK